jgi:hypothetical protein
MGRWFYGLALMSAFAAGCAAPTPAEVHQQSTGDGGNADLSGGGGGGGGGSGSCTDGGTCTSSNPGDCAMGHVVCSGNVQSCVPDVTAQRCYSGPAGTANVGICKPGMQTCIGTLGTCAGEVKPAAIENCFNDLDDDCDGKINNGCPDHLITGTPRALTQRGNPAGGGPFSVRCPANSFVTKIVVYGDNADGWIAGVDIACAAPTLVRGASSYSVTETPVTPNPNHQYAAHVELGNNNTTLSPPVFFDCGTTTFAPGYWSTGRADGGGADALGMACASTALTLSATNQLTIAMTKQGAGTYFGYVSFGTYFDDDCGPGEVLVGYDGRSGNWFDAIQAVCAPLQTVYK